MKCIALFSGGLDSLLAIKIIESQGIEVIPICFESYFFSGERAKEIAIKNSLNPIFVDFSEEHLSIVKNPVIGYGKNLNPCIDCHALMIKTAYNVMKDLRASFIITGEVLNERPFSQTKEGLSKVDKLTGLGEITLRPLSAKLLEKPKVLREKWVKEELLLDIQGRSRKRQLELVKKYNIVNFEQPAGGCKLTDENFCKRIKPFIKEITGKVIKIFNIGRHFFYEGSHIIIGRNEKENLILESTEYLHFKLKEKPGPTGIFRILKENSHRNFASQLILRYSGEKQGEIIFSDNIIIYATERNVSYFEKYLIR